MKNLWVEWKAMPENNNFFALPYQFILKPKVNFFLFILITFKYYKVLYASDLQDYPKKN